MRDEFAEGVRQYEATRQAPIVPSPEERLATMIREDLGVIVHPQALRMFIRTRWARVSKAAHEIHDA
jgi:hypothetical protein